MSFPAPSSPVPKTSSQSEAMKPGSAGGPTNTSTSQLNSPTLNSPTCNTSPHPNASTPGSGQLDPKHNSINQHSTNQHSINKEDVSIHIHKRSRETHSNNSDTASSLGSGKPLPQSRRLNLESLTLRRTRFRPMVTIESSIGGKIDVLDGVESFGSESETKSTTTFTVNADVNGFQCVRFKINAIRRDGYPSIVVLALEEQCVDGGQSINFNIPFVTHMYNEDHSNNEICWKKLEVK